jgi:hypothetical protein
VVLGFKGSHPRAENWVREYSANLVVEIVEDQKLMVRDRILLGVEQSTAPRTVALDLVGRLNKITGKREGGLVGLTSQQASYVENARQELLSNDPAKLANYFTRKRRDSRMDGLVKRAMKEGRALTATEVAKITDRYKSRLLKLRGDTIARTEAISAFGEGQIEGYRQLLDTGSVAEEQIERTWSATRDKFTRDTHSALSGQKKRGLREPFTTGSGAQMRYPRDRSLGAGGGEIINCRCYMNVRVKPR